MKNCFIREDQIEDQSTINLLKMNAKLRLKLQQFEDENKDLKIEIKKMAGEIKMLKTVNQ